MLQRHHIGKPKIPKEKGKGFDTIHGDGSFRKLMRLFTETKTPYSQIAREFGVTRSDIQDLHDRYFPHERRTGWERWREAALQRWENELFKDEDFGYFYKRATRYFRPGEIKYIPSGSGFRKDAVTLKRKKVLLRRATKRKAVHVYKGGRTYVYEKDNFYVVKTPREEADFVFYSAQNHTFWFVPYSELTKPARNFFDVKGSWIYPYKNNFSGLFPFVK